MVHKDTVDWSPFNSLSSYYEVELYERGEPMNYIVKEVFLCPQRNFGRHIVIALSVRPSVCPSRFRVRSISPIFFEVGISN